MVRSGKMPTKFVAQIKCYIRDGYRDTELGRAFGVHRHSVAAIRSGKHRAGVVATRSVPSLDKVAAAIRAEEHQPADRL